MNVWIQKHHHKIGTPPGSLSLVNNTISSPSQTSLIIYDPDSFETPIFDIKTSQLLNNKKTSWLNIDGLKDLELIKNLGEKFNIHDLTLEDILNTDQRPKIEFFENYLYVSLKMLTLENDTITSKQISLILQNNLVITFQEKPGDIFDNIKDRIKNKLGRIRHKGSDYLLFALLDSVVDHYYVLLDQFGDKIENLEEEAVYDPTDTVRETIHTLKREIIFLKKSVRPIQEMIVHLLKEETPHFKENTQKYIRDLLDHVNQIHETIDSYRELTSHLLEIYLSGMSHKMNQVMKVLTIVSTLFIPLTFIAGVYGMNFKYMPELTWKWAYPATWGIMIIISFLSILFFKKKKWF